MRTLIFLILAIGACTSTPKKEATRPTLATIGTWENIDPSAAEFIDSTGRAEVITEGFDWAEGPLWVEEHQMLLFSDVPQNKIYKWTEADGKSVYLSPSGYTDSIKRGGEMGSNGLTLDPQGRLVLTQCGNRQMARMNAPLNAPEADFVSLATNYKGQKFNSPNDAVFDKNGDLFFTDPPYGLEKQMQDPLKEIPFQGVYQVNERGEVILICDTLTRPNGIAFLPGDSTLIVANSDTDKPIWYAFDRQKDGSFSDPGIFYSAKGYNKSLNGLPDGLKVDSNGHVFATGPGGLWIFNSSGQLLGKYTLPNHASNCALSADEKTLYITYDNQVLRLRLRE